MTDSLTQLLGRLWLHITVIRKKQLGLLFIFMLLTSVAEVVSIGAVIPFLSILGNPDAVFEYELMKTLVNQVGITTSSQLLLPLTIAFIVAAVTAGGMRIVLLWGQTRLAHAVGADLSYQIYKRTLFQPYSVHVTKNSSEVVAGVSTKANQVVRQTVQPILISLSSILMLIVILAALIVIEPFLSMTIMLGFGLIYGFLMWLTKNRLISNSRRISGQTSQVIKVLQEGLGGIRDVLIDGSQAIYCKTYRTADLSLRHALANNQIMAQSPRFGVESLGMVLIAGVAYMLGSGQDDLDGVLPMLGALAIGAQRMLPMLQQAYSSWSNIRGSQAVLRDALELLEQPLPKYVEDPTSEVVLFQKEIVLKQIAFRYKKDCSWVLKDVDLKILKGSSVGFIGTTGSGKSTLLDVVMGLLQPNEGEFLVDGVLISDRNYRGWQTHIAHIPQNIFLSDATIAENIAFGMPREQIDHERVRLVARKAQIAETVEKLREKYQTTVGERGIRLSGGQRQRIGIARALYKNADVLIFDEATSALDNETEHLVMKEIDELKNNITILMVAHRVTTLRNCDVIIELENGAIKRKGGYASMID
jgi:ATP-binding cassette, subfamily B, bacterial PglK